MDRESLNSDSNLDAPTPPPGRVRVPRLTTVASVRKELGRQYGEHLRGHISNKCLAVRVAALRAVRESLVEDDFVARLVALEMRTGGAR